MHILEIGSRGARRARVHSLVQLGGLIVKSGLLETFHIKLGLDLQRDISMKEPIAALFKGLLTLNEDARSDTSQLSLWARQGLEILAHSKES